MKMRLTSIRPSNMDPDELARIDALWAERARCPLGDRHYYTEAVVLFGFIPWGSACRCGRRL